MPKVNLEEGLRQFADLWRPKIIADLNDYKVQLVKVQGEWVWHNHDDTDELFLVNALPARRDPRVERLVSLRSGVSPGRRRDPGAPPKLEASVRRTGRGSA